MPAVRRYFPTSMVLVRRRSGWIGLAIECDLTVRARTAGDALVRLVDLVGATLCAELEAGSDPALRKPADPLWDLFHELMHHGCPAEDPGQYPYVAVPALFLVENEDGRFAWSQMQGLPVGATAARPAILRPVDRIPSTV